MKFKNKESMVIRGESAASPDVTPQADVITTSLLRITREAAAQPISWLAEEGEQADSSSALVAARSAPAPLMVLLSASHAALPPVDRGISAADPEIWVPLWRSTDSLSLLGESGVLQVGVNDLGWVVYDWIPGP